MDGESLPRRVRTRFSTRRYLQAVSNLAPPAPVTLTDVPMPDPVALSGRPGASRFDSVGS
ncbi:hypothetical protein GCM10028833_35540 [Glycomyces tarimensis]